MQMKTQSSVSMLLLKADSCNVALLSDANAGRTKKKHLGLMMLHFFIKESAASLFRGHKRHTFVFKGLASLKSR